MTVRFTLKIKIIPRRLAYHYSAGASQITTTAFARLEGKFITHLSTRSPEPHSDNSTLQIASLHRWFADYECLKCFLVCSNIPIHILTLQYHYRALGEFLLKRRKIMNGSDL